jgi:hypothetical protein
MSQEPEPSLNLRPQSIFLVGTPGLGHELVTFQVSGAQTLAYHWVPCPKLNSVWQWSGPRIYISSKFSEIEVPDKGKHDWEATVLDGI